MSAHFLSKKSFSPYIIPKTKGLEESLCLWKCSREYLQQCQPLINVAFSVSLQMSRHSQIVSCLIEYTEKCLCTQQKLENVLCCMWEAFNGRKPDLWYLSMLVMESVWCHFSAIIFVNFLCMYSC